MPDEREFDAEEVVFRKDGTIVWKVDGQRAVLRRPKFKELRTLREEISDLAEKSREERKVLIDEQNDLIGTVQDRLSALGDDPPIGALVSVQAEMRAIEESDAYADVQSRLRAQRDASDRDLLGWFVESVLGRFAKPVPTVDDPEDLPPWCIDQTFIKDVLEHWSSVPRRPGVV